MTDVIGRHGLAARAPSKGISELLNTRWHERALQLFMVVVAFH